ncbi:MAG: hypothetical protein J3R72DRAFT_527227 [Linnemannia gamsii]|nr:MAG: hypothetical protein J3R72DRAFT_527227 [Linnemannia gamsii]
MADSIIGLYCIVDGETTSNAFLVEIESSKTIGTLRKLIKSEKKNDFQDVDADKLTLWRVSIPDSSRRSAITLNALHDKANLSNPRTPISELFPGSPDDNTYILVQRPPPAAKRDREEDGERFPKRHHTHTLMDAIEEAGLTEKAVVDGRSSLFRLNSKERVSLISFMGEAVDESNTFYSLSSTALALHHTTRKDMDKLSATDGAKWEAMDKLSTPDGTKLPVINTKDLYVRTAYRDLYNTIYRRFETKRPHTGYESEKYVVVTGTAGIGKSAFLVYFAIRLLAESDDDDPPIIIFHTKGSSECFVFGGHSTVRFGDIKAFKPFLNLSDTWYFVDSSPNPVLDQAKTVISASPKTLFSEDPQFKDVDKEVSWRYYMAPWDLEELKNCRTNVADFEVVPLEAVVELYSKLGGVPRYVLRWPMQELKLSPEDLEGSKDLDDAKTKESARLENAKIKACARLEGAINMAKDPVMLMQFFAQGKDSLEFSSPLIHRWPMGDHSTFRLEWASIYVAEKVADLLNQDACNQMLERLIADPKGSASGVIFEAYVLRTFRDGGHTFEIRNLENEDEDLASLEIPRNPKTEHFDKITPVPADTLCIPKICNYACVDLLLAPRDLFQITVSDKHPIKGVPLSKLLESLTQAGWGSSKERRLFFVVPGRVYADFKKQNYLTLEEKVYKTIPVEIQCVKQYVLKIDLESAVSGKSPGLQVLAQPNAGSSR